MHGTETSTYRSTTTQCVMYTCSFLFLTVNVPSNFFNATHQVKVIAIGIPFDS